MESERRNITQPADWWDAWEAAAAAAKQDLSTWIGEKCNRSLTKKVRSALSTRGKRGRPWPKKDAD